MGDGRYDCQKRMTMFLMNVTNRKKSLVMVKNLQIYVAFM